MSDLQFEPKMTQKRPARKKLWIALSVAGCLGLGALGTTLSANISLNGGGVVEFGQGMTQTSACDSAITITPISTFINDNPGAFKFTGLQISNLDTTDQIGNTQGCAGKYFEIKTYQENGDVNTPTLSFVVRNDGTFVSEDGEMSTQNASTEASSGLLTFDTPTVLATNVYRMTFQSKLLTGCYGHGVITDGSTEQNAAPSGYYLAQNCPGLSSGTYWIKSESMPNALQMYVDMTEEGGGYDFYFITAGPSVNFVTDTNAGTPLGLDLVMPRSKYHWRAMKNAVLDHRPSGDFYQYFRTAYGIYRNVNGSLNGDYTSTIMNSQDGSSDWRVKDGGRWWLRDTTYGEPNGDYTLYGLLSFGMNESWDLGDFGFNDGGSESTGVYYLVSTNAKP